MGILSSQRTFHLCLVDIKLTRLLTEPGAYQFGWTGWLAISRDPPASASLALKLQVDATTLHF